eukprot:symbB.v1.2.041176.t1/scaffold7894.1/size10478/3
MVPNEAEVGVPLDFAEDLSDDVLSRVALHSCARDALCLAICSRSLLWAIDTMAHRLFAETFGTSDFPDRLTTRSGSVGCRAKILIRLDRARSKNLDDLRETFSWAAGHGYCNFLTSLTRQSWESNTFLARLLNGRKGSFENIPPPLWRAAKRHQATAVTLLLELRADPEALALSCLDIVF